MHIRQEHPLAIRGIVKLASVFSSVLIALTVTCWGQDRDQMVGTEFYDSFVNPMAGMPLFSATLGTGTGALNLPVLNTDDRSAESGHGIHISEPLLFDLVRPLGARKGELEFNTLAVFQWQNSNTNLADDPIGSGPTTKDRRGIEWAPEIEYAIADNFAIEFEFPFEGSTLEEYKLGLQWTIGTAFDDRYIHGFQALIEPDTRWGHWSTTLLYLGGIRFDETWSALFMIGGRMNLEGPRNSDSLERLFNGSIFADLSDSLTVGLETNFAAHVDGTSEIAIVPQVHYQFTEHFQVQSGLGFGMFTEGSEQSFILRVIYSR